MITNGLLRRTLPASPSALYTTKRREKVEGILKKSRELSLSVAKKIEQQCSLQKMEQDKEKVLNRVKNAEQSLNTYLEQLNKSSKTNVENNSNIVQSKYDLFELPKLHKQLVGEYNREIQTLSSTYKSVTYKNNIDLRAAQQNYRENRPDWLVDMGKTREYIRQNGYNNNLKWRSKTVKVLMKLKVHLSTLPGHFGTKLSIDIQEMCKNINLLSTKQAMIKLENFTERAIRICSKFNPKYESVRSKLINVTEQVQMENSQAESLLKGTKQKFMAHHNDIIQRIAKARRYLRDQGIIDQAEGAFQANGWRGLSLRKSLIQYDLMVANRMSREGNDREKLRSYFYNMLLQCANAGAWQESFYIYAAMLGCRVPPERKTFRYIFMACKNSLPPQSKRCLLMVKEMIRIGLHGDRNLYHIAFSACAMAGDHRRTGQIFKIMTNDGVKPSSGTYDLIVKTVSKYCKAEDSAEIYDSLKSSGVPERIAYVAAFKTSNRYISRLEEDTATYYKLDSREQQIFEKTWLE